MVAQFVSDLHRALSHDRLEAYRGPVGAGDLEMLTNSFWNIDLAEALVPCLHALEVALRNSIHTVFTQEYDTDMWFYRPGLLESGQLNQVAGALRDVAKQPPLLSGKIVAALNFGFWVALLSDRYQRPIWQPNNYRLLHQVFPNAVGLQRHVAHNRLNDIRDLRNRTFHYEAIWYRHNLRQEHTDIHQVIEWISPTLHRAIHAVDHFPAILNGKSQVEADLKRHLGIT